MSQPIAPPSLANTQGTNMNPYIIVETTDAQDLEERVCKLIREGTHVPIGGVSVIRILEGGRNDNGLLYSQAMVVNPQWRP